MGKYSEFICHSNIIYYLLPEWPFLILWLQLSTVPWMNIKFQCRFLYWILNSKIQYLIDISNALLLQIELIIFITVNTIVFPRLPFHWWLLKVKNQSFPEFFSLSNYSPSLVTENDEVHLERLLFSLPSLFSSVQFSHSVLSDSATPWIAACQASLSLTNSQSSLKLTSIESVMLSSHLILCRPLLLLPSIPPSIRVFSNESTLRMRWPKYWTFPVTISLSHGFGIHCNPGPKELRISFEIEKELQWLG